jgi:hypothetical protein
LKTGLKNVESLFKNQGIGADSSIFKQALRIIRMRQPGFLKIRVDAGLDKINCIGCFLETNDESLKT